MNWVKYSKEREHLTMYERRILRKSSNTKCPHCKNISVNRNHSSPYMSMTYYCDICGFAFAEEMFTDEYRNHGYKLHKIDQQKVRVAKIKRLLSKQKKSMKIFDSIMEWLRHSEAGRSLTIIEKRILSSSNNTKCPTCKSTSIKNVMDLIT